MKRRERMSERLLLSGLCLLLVLSGVCGCKKKDGQTDGAKESTVESEKSTGKPEETAGKTKEEQAADGWHSDETGTYYILNGERLTGIVDLTKQEREKNELQSEAVFLYAFDEDGYVLPEGWLEEKGERYYVTEGGRLCIGEVQIEGEYYTFDSDGTLGHGLRMAIAAGDARAVYYYEEAGRVKNEWRTVGERTFYFGPDGKGLTGWQEIDGKTYYFGVPAAGSMSGVFLAPYTMAVGEQEIEGKTYRFGEDGVLEES